MAEYGCVTDITLNYGSRELFLLYTNKERLAIRKGRMV